MSKGFASNYRIVLLATGLFLAFGGLAARLVFLHVINREELLKYVEQARRSFIVEQARRGTITDAKDNILATSVQLVDIGVDPQMLRHEDEAHWPDLLRLLPGVTEADLRAAAAKRLAAPARGEDREGRAVQWIKLAEAVDETVYDRIKELGIRGVYGTRAYRRSYPQKTLAAHVVGYVNRESQPACGVEAYMDFFLRGENGWRESEKDGRRQELAQFRTREVPPANGYDVVLSLETPIQRMIEAELQMLQEKYHPLKATIIVSDARTGFILGLANIPTFDLNEFNRASIEQLRNVAVTDVFEPGSTFKIVPASGALEEGLVTPASAFDVASSDVEYRGHHIRLPRDDHGAETLDVTGIISHSSNRGAAHLAMLLGDDRFYDYTRRFGFGQKTGFPFGGEVLGLLKPPKDWYPISITRIPMGQGIAATPMQVHYAMGTIANGGVRLEPQLFRQIRDSDGGPVFVFGERPCLRVVSERTAQTMARLLMGVVSPEGTAPVAAIPGYEVAAKTGTSQKVIDGRYSTTHHVGSFVGFFPATRPRVVISVIVDDPTVPKSEGGVGYGRVVAAPSFKHIAEQLIQYLDIKPVTSPATGRYRFAQAGRGAAAAGVLQ